MIRAFKILSSSHTLVKNGYWNQTQVCYSKYLEFEFYDTKNKQKIKTDKHTKGKINEEMIKKTSEACFAKLLLFF